MRKIVRFLALLLAALSSGVFFGTRASIGPSTKGFSSKTYVEVQQASVRNLQPVMALLLPGAVAANLADIVLSARKRGSSSFTLLLAGLLSQLASFAITGIVQLPINARLMEWSADDPPEGWEALRDRWDTFHSVRTVFSVLGMMCLLAAALTSSENSERN